MIESLVEIVGTDTVTLHHQPIPRSGSWSSQGQFLLDAMVGRDTVFGIFVEDAENHHIKSVSFTDGQGQVFGPYTKMSSMLDTINLKTINFAFMDHSPFNKVAGESKLWKYNIDWYKELTHMDSIVTVWSKPKEDSSTKNLQITSWASSDSSSLVVSSSPLTLYIQVSMAGLGVVGARVSLALLVRHSNGSSSKVSQLPLLMVDDGVGGEILSVLPW
jgi:hypothetical protein